MEEQNEILTAVREGFARVDQQFARVDQQFAQVHQQFAQVDEQFARVDQQFARVHQRFAQVDEQFQTFRAEVDGKFAELRTEIQKVGDDARLAHVHIENLRHDLHIFDEGESSPLEQRVSALEVRVTKIEHKRYRKKER